jgi:hypothetical protein
MSASDELRHDAINRGGYTLKFRFHTILIITIYLSSKHFQFSGI